MGGRRYQVVQPEVGDPAKVVGSRIPVLVVSGIAAACFVASWIGRTIEDPQLPSAGLVFGGVFSFIALVMLVIRSAFGNPQWKLEPVCEDGADLLRCTLWIKPGATVSVVDARLVICEQRHIRVSTGTGSSRRMEETTIARFPFVLEPAGPGEFRGEVALPAPESVPVSLSEVGRDIVWVVRCNLEHESGSKHGSETILKVSPA